MQGCWPPLYLATVGTRVLPLLSTRPPRLLLPPAFHLAGASCSSSGRKLGNPPGFVFTTRKSAGFLHAKPSSVLPPHFIAQFDRYAAGVPEIFRGLTGFAISYDNEEAVRDHISFSVDLRELHQFIQDGISLNRPARFIQLLREQLDYVLSLQNVSLPPSMLS